jgi:hypothetical protein
MVLSIDGPAARRAFERYLELYVADGRSGFVEPWALGARAFGDPADADAGERLYDLLRRRWLVFRGPPGAAPPAAEVVAIFTRLSGSLPALRSLRLTELERAHLPMVEAALREASRVKANKGGPSLVATTKFLHFWNPRLFVIVDAELIDGYALRHRWLRDDVVAVARAEGLTAALDSPFRTRWRGLPYVHLLFWAAHLHRASPSIRHEFARALGRLSGVDGLPRDAATFEAAAIEWLLLGLIELPPAGVGVDRTGW